MTTKSAASTAKVDWDTVNRATEVPRTFEVITPEGNHFFKMYKPSEAKAIFKKTGWRGKMVGVRRY